MLRTLLRGAALAVSAACLVALAATPSSAVQRTVTIYQLQDTTAAGAVVIGSTDTVTTTGIITGADTRPTGFGFYIQDQAGGDYSGVLVFTGGANVFADSGYARGDIITVRGRTTEFSGETEIISLTGGAFDAPPPTTRIGSTAVPAPINLANYGVFAETAAYQVAERYEGVFVRITNGRTARNTGVGTNQFLIVDNAQPMPLDSVRVDGQTLAFPSLSPPALGVVVTEARGIGNQRAPRGYSIQLRDGADIVVPSPPVLLNAFATANNNIRLLFDRALNQASAQNTANYSRSITLKQIDAATLVAPSNQIVDLTTTTEPQVPGESEAVTASGVQSSLLVPMAAPGTQNFRAGVVPIQMVQTNTPGRADTSQYVFEQVTVRGIVHARDGGLYYFQDGVGINPSSGMAVFAPIQSLAEGDDVTMSGVVTEFGGLSQLTEFSGLDYQEIHSSGNAKFAPVVASPGDIGPLTGVEPYPGERYEGMFVELQNVTVIQDSLPNGQFAVQGQGGAGDTVRVDDTMFRQDILYNEGQGIVVSILRGLVNDAFGQYTVNPRRQADIVAEPVGVEPGAGALAFAFRGVTPTPVSFAAGGRAMLHFTLPEAGRVSARVYDVAGRLVARPFSDAAFAAGPQAVAFDGRSLAGKRLDSGIFFVQLQLGNRVATGKLVVTD